MTDPAIIEAAARALFEIMERLDPELDDPDWEKLTKDDQGFFSLCVTAVLKIVTPLIEAAALERAAQVAEKHTNWPATVPEQWAREEIAAAIRALKQGPSK